MYASIFREDTAGMAKVAGSNTLKKTVTLPSAPIKVVLKDTQKIASISFSRRSANSETNAFTNIIYLVTRVKLIFSSRRSNHLKLLLSFLLIKSVIWREVYLQ